MGTNFYLRQKLSEQEKENTIVILPSKIHIGKRSGGWKFHWDHNYFQYYQPTKESLIEWLKSGQIVDEYDEEFTFDQFWNKEVGDCLTEGWDMQSYVDEHGPETYWDMKKRKRKLLRKCPELKDVEFSNQGDFYIDDLRYSVLTDYS